MFKLGNSGGAPGPEQNICFMNSVMVLLFSVTAIRNFFKEKKYKGYGGQKTPVCDEVSSIFNCIGARTSAGALRQLMRSMSPKFEYIGNGQQQGAPEFLEDLLETIENELKDSGNDDKSKGFRNCMKAMRLFSTTLLEPGLGMVSALPAAHHRTMQRRSLTFLFCTMRITETILYNR